MTPQEKLEHEIKVLEEAHQICNNQGFSFGLIATCKDRLETQLEALKKPKFRYGTLGRYKTPIGTSVIVEYPDSYYEKHKDYTFEPLPKETILRHLAPEGAVGWKYNSFDSIYLTDKKEKIVDDYHGNLFIIPAPYREDWQNVKGEL